MNKNEQNQPPTRKKAASGFEPEASGSESRLLTSEAAPRLWGEVSGRSAGPEFVTTTGVHTCARAGAHMMLLWRVLPVGATSEAIHENMYRKLPQHVLELQQHTSVA